MFGYKLSGFLPILLVLGSILDVFFKFSPQLLDILYYYDPKDEFEQRHVDIVPLYALSNLEL